MILGNTTSILLYIAIFSLSTFLLFLGERKNKKILIVLALALPIILAGIRSQVGTDWIAYNQFYEEVSQEDSQEFWRQIREHETEPLMMFLGLFTSSLHTGSWVIFTLYATITLIFMYLTLRKLVPKYSWLLFGVFLFSAFPDSFNTMRQMAAMSVLSYVFSLIAMINCHDKTPRQTPHMQKLLSRHGVLTARLHGGEPPLPRQQPAERSRKNFRYGRLVGALLLIILAINLHYATLALLPVLLIPWLVRKIDSKKLSYALTILLVFSLLLFPILIQLLATSGILSPKHYETLTNDFGSFYNFNFLICIILGAFSFFYFGKKKDDYLVPLILLGANYAAVGFYSRYLGRLADFFWPFVTILAWRILDSLKLSKRVKIIITCVISILYFVLAYIVMGTSEIVPYGTIF